MKSIYQVFFPLIIVLASVGVAGAQSVKYTVQLEAAPTKEAAEEKLKELKGKNVQAYVVRSSVPGKGTFYRVRVGTFLDQNAARKYGADLQRRGVVSDFFIAPYEKPTEDVVASAAPAKPAPAPKEQPIKPVVSVKPPEAAPNNSQVAANNVPANSGKSAASSATAPTSAPANKPANDPINSPINTPANNAEPKAAAEGSFTTTSVEPKAAATSVPTTTNVEPKAAANGVPATTPVSAPAPAAGFVRFQDQKAGYSFEYPSYWTGQPLNAKEASDQRVNAGALFKSQEDAAFLNAIWNELDKANNPSNDNDLIIEVILKSMSSGDGTQLQETARRVVNENGLVKTYLELKAAFQSQGQASPLDFIGKAVVIRAAKGILLVVAFYSKDAPSNAAGVAERIIASASAPE